MVGEQQVYPQGMPEIPTDCLMFYGDEGDFELSVINIEFNGLLYYSVDGNDWRAISGSGTTFTFKSVDKKLFLRGMNNSYFYRATGTRLSLSAKAGCYGNLQTLLNYTSMPTTAANCTSLFQNCTYLTHAPDLSAINLTSSCYNSMFRGCSNLTKAPELPATTLAAYCYYNMFYDCTNIRLSQVQDDIYKTAYRIPSMGDGTTASGACTNMFWGTGGSFTGTPSINTIYYGAWE